MSFIRVAVWLLCSTVPLVLIRVRSNVHVSSDVSKACKSNDDAYRGVCRRLTRLCPRLVPSPLWGLSLARVARMAPHAAVVICDHCPEVVEEVHRYWMGLPRDSKCEVCGAPGSEIDEDWRYCVIDNAGKQRRGVAYLKRLRLLCEKCHLAKHQGYAQVVGEELEALEHLAQVNRLSLAKVEELVDKAFLIHAELSGISDWTIEVGNVEGLEEGLKERVEELLNAMYKRGFSIVDEWLYYEYPRYGEEVAPRVLREVAAVLAEASKRLRRAKATDEWAGGLLEVVREVLTSRGIRVLNREFKLYVKLLLDDKACRIQLQLAADCVLEGGVDDCVGDLSQLLEECRDLVGKWMVFVPVEHYPRAFRDVLEALEETGLAYAAKIKAGREEYGSGGELPVLIYAPASFAAHYIAEVAKVVRDVLDKYGVDKSLFFKPDVFTRRGIYSGRAEYKSYIYVYR